MKYEVHIPRGLEVVTGTRIDQREATGVCTSCFSSLPDEPCVDPQYPRGRFCSTGCLNDYRNLR